MMDLRYIDTEDFRRCPIIMTPLDVADAMCVTRQMAYTIFSRADFPSIRVGRKLLVPKSAFLKWLDAEIIRSLS